jgi:uncharacterized protein DUF4129
VTRGGNSDRRLIRRSGGALATGAVAALALAAVGLHAAAGSALHDGGVGGGISALLGVLFTIGALVAATKYRAHVRSTEVHGTAADRLRNATVAVLFATAVLVPFALILLHHDIGTGNGLVPTDPDLSTGRASSAASPYNVAPTPRATGHGIHLNLTYLMLALVILTVAAVIAAAVVVIVRVLRGASREGAVAPQPAVPAESGLEDEALADALLAGRSALEGFDARAAIIACYAAMEDSLRQAGIARERADSPTDLLRRATARDTVDRAAAAELTELFREARFSTHPMGEGHLAAARRALDTITASVAEALARRAAEAGEAVGAGDAR